MPNIVEIILKATDQASATLKKTGGELNKLDSSLESMIGPAALAAAGIAAVGKFMVDSVNGAQAYNLQVKKLSENLSLTSEETSRIIQVADDYGISINSVTTALQFATKNGFAPTVENLANLADHLKTIQDPTKRAAELTKIFGRNWSELTPLLNAGGDAIRNGSAAIADGLIVTQQAIDNSIKLRDANDELDDSWTSIKNNVGNNVIPVLADLTNQINQNMQMTALYKKVQEEGIKVNWLQINSMVSRAKATGDYTAIIQVLTKAIEDNNAAINESAANIGKDTNEQLKLNSATQAASPVNLLLRQGVGGRHRAHREVERKRAGLAADELAPAVEVRPRPGADIVLHLRGGRAEVVHQPNPVRAVQVEDRRALAQPCDVSHV